MAGFAKEMLARPIQLADQLTNSADKARSFKHECAELKAKTERLAALLGEAARARTDPYERPVRLIVANTEQVLRKALALVNKCRASCIMRRMFTTIPSRTFRKTLIELDDSIGDVRWLLVVSADNRDGIILGMPPIAANQPILCQIWEQVGILSTGTLDERSDAAASLASLASDHYWYAKLIIEEGGVPPLLKLAKEGKMGGRENAARAIGLLGLEILNVLNRL